MQPLMTILVTLLLFGVTPAWAEKLTLAGWNAMTDMQKLYYLGGVADGLDTIGDILCPYDNIVTLEMLLATVRARIKDNPKQHGTVGLYVVDAFRQLGCEPTVKKKIP